MKNQIRFLLLALVFAIVAIPVSAQMLHSLSHSDSSYLEQFRDKTHDEALGRVWGNICAMNRSQYPDSNKIMPGDFIAMPLGEHYQATAGGTSHMWDAARCFTYKIAIPYLNGTLQMQTHQPDLIVDSTKVSSRAYPGWLAPVMVVIVISIALYFLITSKKWNRKPVADPPFISSGRVPLDPMAATQEELRPLVQEAFGRVYGEKNFDIIGDVQGGIIDGPQTIFFLDGSHRIENFNEEDGFRARLKFKSSGVEALVVGKLGCFNPCWSAERSEFSGTFTPYGSNQPERIGRISENQAGDVGENIRRIRRGEEAVVEPPNATPVQVQEPSTAQEPPTSEEKKPEVSVDEIQISAGRLTLKGGRVNLSFVQLKELIHEVVPKSGTPSESRES